MDKELLIAAYETQRMIVLSAYAANTRLVPAALAFAYQHRLAPIFHDTGVRQAHGADPFDAIHPVKGEFMQSVVKFVDEKWRAGDLGAIEFGKLEDIFGGYKANRMEIAHTMHYAFLASRFDDDVYAAIQKNAPIEAQGMTRPFPPDDVSLE